MTGFEFDTGTTPGTNRTTPATACQSCGGDRFVLVDETDGFETYARCSACNPSPVRSREPVPVDAWWKE